MEESRIDCAAMWEENTMIACEAWAKTMCQNDASSLYSGDAPSSKKSRNANAPEDMRGHRAKNTPHSTCVTVSPTSPLRIR